VVFQQALYNKISITGKGVIQMSWVNLYSADRQPTKAEIAEYIANPLWDEMNDFLRKNYKVEPSYSYSTCSGQPGWNIKYQKAGRSLCTLYPMSGYFIALVVIGVKEQVEAEFLLSACSKYTQELYQASHFSAGGKWLMINVVDDQILDDVKQLIQTRRKIKPVSS